MKDFEMFEWIKFCWKRYCPQSVILVASLLHKLTSVLHQMFQLMLKRSGFRNNKLLQKARIYLLNFSVLPVIKKAIEIEKGRHGENGKRTQRRWQTLHCLGPEIKIWHCIRMKRCIDIRQILFTTLTSLQDSKMRKGSRQILLCGFCPPPVSRFFSEKFS